MGEALSDLLSDRGQKNIHFKENLYIYQNKISD